MACNCATTEQINKLYEKYGNKEDVKKLPFKGKVRHYLWKAGVLFLMIFIIPILALYVFYKGAFDDDKKISIRKLFRLKPITVQNVK